MSEQIHIRPDGSWDYKGEDSRLKNSRADHQVTYRIFNELTKQFEYQTLDRVFCMNCGADGGWSARTAVYVKFLCDRCFQTARPDSFCPMPSDEETRWRMGLPEKTEQ